MERAQSRERGVSCIECSRTTWNVDAVCDACAANLRLPSYEPTYPVFNGVEIVTNRLDCCGAGPDRADERTGERLHLPGCRAIAADAIASARSVLGEAS